MKKQILKTAIAVAALTASLAAYAVPTIIVTDGVVSSGPITTPGGGSVIYVNGSFDNSWSVVITGGTTKPLFGNATDPVMDITIQASSSGSVNDLTITFSETDFGPTAAAFSSELDGHMVTGSGSPVTYNAYYDAGNTVGALTTQLTDIGPLSPGESGFYPTTTASSASVALSAYSLSQVVKIGGATAGAYSLN